MLKIFLCLLMMLFSFMMYYMNNPLSMGLMILMQTFLTCIISGMLINTYWFSYILFLTFLGGLLVLFLYVSSVASNEMFFISFNKILFFMIMMLIITLISFMMSHNMKWMNFNFNDEMNQFSNFSLYFFNNENKINLSKLYNNQTFLLMLMMILYLFITLVAVVKITNIFYGPIRSSIF